MERPGKVVSPQTLYQGLLEELQLVGHATRPARIFDWRLRRHRWRLGHRVRQGRTLKVLVQQGGLADAFAWAGVLVHAAAGQPDQGAGGGGDRQMNEKGHLSDGVWNYREWNFSLRAQNGPQRLRLSCWNFDLLYWCSHWFIDLSPTSWVHALVEKSAHQNSFMQHTTSDATAQLTSEQSTMLGVNSLSVDCCFNTVVGGIIALVRQENKAWSIWSIQCLRLEFKFLVNHSHYLGR